ncbi:hypothetical protein CHS0354_033520 [Potamilus streckersoni]|uniref:Uncharacterized protein n=1 Tax=Potamilus streckersoni TaxID=2493646 RepID=A0AAE0S782_9BIVA|nr:hypothetical protein CHS0354_033520 [Potamilus streckersoni]
MSDSNLMENSEQCKLLLPVCILLQLSEHWFRFIFFVSWVGTRNKLNQSPKHLSGDLGPDINPSHKPLFSVFLVICMFAKPVLCTGQAFFSLFLPMSFVLIFVMFIQGKAMQ